MARRQVPLQVNKFSKGLNTEQNPLLMAPDTSIDELNMEIDPDGSRFKRLGFGYELSHTTQNTATLFVSEDKMATSLFRWENAGGVTDKVLMVVQVGGYLGVHDLDDEVSASDGLIYSEQYSADTYETIFSYAVVDGLLVVVNGLKDVLIYEYDSDLNTVSKTTETLLIRDLFGIEVTGLTEQSNLTTRPTSLTGPHTYNLRNQTYSSPRFQNNDEGTVDPIQAVYDDSTDSFYPSNADSVNTYLYADPNDAENRLIERFFSKNLVESTPALGESPKGYFIIDALERGGSRVTEEAELRTNYSTLTFAASNVPTDKTSGGSTVLEEFAGRIWYGGFSGNVIGGDSKSPRMSSYILFSTLVKDKTDISQCYQRADPTSIEDSVLVDTDGGFIRIDGAYGINRFINLEGSLFVLAANGIWKVTGGDGSAFRATNYQVDKVSEDGCVSPNSVVVVGSQIFYWGERGIFNLYRNEFGIWLVRDLSTGTIESFYSNIPEDARRNCSGLFDTFEQKIRWVYPEILETSEFSNELVLDLRYGAFIPLKIATESGGLPLVVNVGKGQPYPISPSLSNITVTGVTVTANGAVVTNPSFKRQDGVKQALYLMLTNYSTTLSYTFGVYRNSDFLDWDSVSYEAYLVSGAVTGGEARYRKQTPYLNVFLKKTEYGFSESLDVLGESSCFLSSRWDWTNSTRAGKWSTPRQVYRPSTTYWPEGSGDDYDTGQTVIVTRNKIRGWGHAVSFKFDSEQGKDMFIHGWSFNLMASEDE